MANDTLTIYPSLQDYAHVYGEAYGVPQPHEGNWLFVLRAYSRKTGVLEEVELEVGEWRPRMSRKETHAAKMAAARETISVQHELLARHNETLGGGKYVPRPSDPSAPRITGTLNVREKRSRM